jgi:hypothetical protein
MISLLAIVASALTIYGAFVTFLLWVWYNKCNESENIRSNVKKDNDRLRAELFRCGSEIAASGSVVADNNSLAEKLELSLQKARRLEAQIEMMRGTRSSIPNSEGPSQSNLYYKFDSNKIVCWRIPD